MVGAFFCPNAVTLITCTGYDDATNTYQYRVVVRAVQVSIEDE